MRYVAFFNPESNCIEVESARDYKEIRYHAEQRGVTGFKQIESTDCLTKKSVRKFSMKYRT
jgi:hypothetical protein